MGYTDQVAQAESSGNPNSADPNSSASGLYGFTDPTFLSTVRQHRPDMADQSDEAILAQKSDPVLSRQMMDALTSDNQAYLAKNGLPVTPGTTYLAHFAGASGATKVLQADPSTPVESILSPAAIKANPFLKGMTAQGLQAWAAKRMGVQAPAVPNQPPAAAPPATLPQPQAPIFAGADDGEGAAAPAPAMPQFAMPTPSPIFVPPRKQIDLSGLRAALAARSPIFASPQG